MNCALELKAIKAEAIIEHEHEEQRKDERARIEFQKMGENAIRFCEEVINARLVEKAKSRGTISCDIDVVFFKDRLGNDYFKVISKDSYYYANGKCSYSPKGMDIALHPMVEYLKAHCLSVDSRRCTYLRYGWGNCSGHTLTITAENCEL